MSVFESQYWNYSYPDGMPIISNIDELQFKNLYLFYKKNFEKLIMKHLNLLDYDNKLNDLENIKNNIDDPFFEVSFMGLKYIYLRNILHIENLNVEELNELIFLYNNQDNDNIEKYILKTCKKVLMTKEDENVKLFVDFNDLDYCVNNRDLVFGINYGYLINSDDEKERTISMINLMDNVNKLGKEVENEIFNELSLSIKIVVNDEYTSPQRYI